MPIPLKFNINVLEYSFIDESRMGGAQTKPTKFTIEYLQNKYSKGRHPKKTVLGLTHFKGFGYLV